MNTKLFVGGLPFIYSDGELKALFTRVGAVISAQMVFDPDRGRTRGFGFVQMSTPELAEAAITTLNGSLLAGKNIYVTIARDKPASKTPMGDRDPTKKNYFPRKAVRNNRDTQPSGPQSPYSQDRPAWPPRRGEPRQGPGGPPRGERSFDKPPRQYKGKRPFDRSGGPAGPSGFSDPAGKPSGFSKPNKWQPRGNDKHSFSAPRKERGDFGPSRPSSKPPKKEFWRKFEKKKPGA